MSTQKVKCLICNEEIDSPLSGDNISSFLNANIFHFTTNHVRELRSYLLPIRLLSIMSEAEDSLYPIYLEFYADGDMLTAHMEVHDILREFIKKNTEGVAKEVSEALKEPRRKESDGRTLPNM